jgi:hypothetical protein
MFKVKTLNVVLVFMFLFCMVTVAQEADESIEMEFVNDLAMGIPIQDVYVDTGMVQRVGSELTDAVLALPVYNSTERHDADFEEPFDIGPFKKGEALGFTFGDWLTTSGKGTYTVDGNRATLDMQFENLVPDGLYTLWCLEISPEAFFELPCGAPDGSESIFTADADGNALVTLEMDAFPPSTDDHFYEVALGWHSDGQTYGEVAGDFGKNVHVPIWFDFLPEHNDLNPVEMDFINELAWGVPIQDVYVEAVMRPQGDMTDEMLEQPLYATTFNNPPDFFEEPFDAGPYPKGEALGFTLGEWLAATGTGMYTVDGDTAKLDLSFEQLVPDGMYTIWCVEINIAELAITEAPCGAADGSTNEFVADDEGNGSISIEVEPFPASTEDVIYEVSLAYHSDGQTYGKRAGEFGQNVHVQLVYDFLPPESD